MSFRNFPLLVAAFLALQAHCPAEDAATTGGRKDRSPQLRFIVVSCAKDQKPLEIMSRTEDGDWRKEAEFELRPSFITEWIPVPAGELHLTEPGQEEPMPVGSLTYPAGTRRAIAVLFYDSDKKQYRADVVDPAQAGFAKGSTLVVNYTPRPGAVSLGNGLLRVEPGGRRVVKPSTEANGMYRMVASYARGEKDPVLCYDRYVADNPDARDILLLLPDKTLGMRVFRLSEFGPFD